MDGILDNLGPWHHRVLILTTLGGFSYTWRVMAMQFMAPKDIQYWCARPNDSISPQEWKILNEGVDLHCYVREYDGSPNVTAKRCDSWEYDRSNHARTLIEEWGAVCGREWLLSYSQSMLMAGTLGSLLFSQISDWYGRRKAILLSYTLSIVTGFAVAATSTFWTFSVARMSNFAVTINVNTLGLESVGARKRAMVVMLAELQWLSGLISFPLVTYFVRDWRFIQIISTAPSIFWLIWTLFLDESPKWLISSGHYDEAKQLLHKIVRRNKLNDVDVDNVIQKARAKIEIERKTQGRASILDLFREFSIIKITAICMLNNTTMAFLYYSLLYYTVDLGSNPYLNLVFTCLTEAPITLLAFFVLKYARRKPVYTITYMISVVSLIALLFPSHTATTAEMVLASIAKLSGQITWSVLLVHISEVFPTPVRAIATGFVHIVSRVGAVTAPLLHPLNGTAYSWVPIAAMVSMCLFGWTTTLILPETFGHSLPDTFHESKELLRAANDNVELKSKTVESSNSDECRISNCGKNSPSQKLTSN
ncbi:solute carrier family 22 member 6-B-like [Tropilaelaps mercedesae]|uniref:Solute carrier family 22 member 6-B-like n=1 Tax=Tropilaelaps mercedesae TaxID=418985 RepID=A0A1V9XE36_9ACAR|nr:solute carrier family 22 member 6-B-like [Tropilaelaps mercedesae]